MIIVRCKECNREISSHPSKARCCGCSNMMTLKGDVVTAIDLTKVVMVKSSCVEQKKNVLTSQDIAWQEARRQRKVRRLDFEVR